MNQSQYPSQAYASLVRILKGEYSPDPAAVGFNFEDGSRLVKTAEGWEASKPGQLSVSVNTQKGRG